LDLSVPQSRAGERALSLVGELGHKKLGHLPLSWGVLATSRGGLVRASVRGRRWVGTLAVGRGFSSRWKQHLPRKMISVSSPGRGAVPNQCCALRKSCLSMPKGTKFEAKKAKARRTPFYSHFPIIEYNTHATRLRMKEQHPHERRAFHSRGPTNQPTKSQSCQNFCFPPEGNAPATTKGGRAWKKGMVLDTKHS